MIYDKLVYMNDEIGDSLYYSRVCIISKDKGIITNVVKVTVENVNDFTYINHGLDS